MKILVHHNGQQLGPYSLEEVRAALAAGALLPNDLAWQEGAPNWVPLGSLPALDFGAAGTRAPAGYGGANPPSSGLAISSLVLGILSICCFSFLAGIPGIICGHLGRSQVKRSGGSISGEGLALAGLITSYFGSFFGIFILAAIAIPAFVSARQMARSNISLQQERQIASACFLYASNHGGKLPNELKELVPDYLQDEKLLQDPAQLGKTEVGYLYLGAGRSRSEGDLQVLLVSKAEYHLKRAVVRFDGSARVEPYALPAEDSTAQPAPAH